MERTLTSTFVRTELADGRTIAGVVQASEPSFQFAAARPVLPAYFVLGIEHILGGIDHVFFVIGLILLRARVVATGRRAHRLHSRAQHHLGVAALGLGALPSAPVEVVIALSIVLVAAEALALARRSARLGGQLRAGRRLVAFAFGLLHGFGFAGALAEIGPAAGRQARRVAVVQRRRGDRPVDDRRGRGAADALGSRVASSAAGADADRGRRGL